MKQRKRNVNEIVNAITQKTELVPGVPLLEIAGQCRVLIENHRGIIAYSPCQIAVRVQFGSYRITGCDLKIAKMGKEQLVIQGRIDSVQLLRRC